MGRDHFSSVRTAIPQLVKAVLNHSESGPTFSAMSEDGVGSGLMVALEAINSTGRTRRLIKRDAVKNPLCKYDFEKQIRAWRSWFERASDDLNYKVLLDAVGHCAWQITHRHVRSDGRKQIERLRGRPHNGQDRVRRGESFQRSTEGCGMSKLYDEWSLRLWMEQILLSDGHYRNTPRRCRSIRKCSEDLRWFQKQLFEMIGDPWNTS